MGHRMCLVVLCLAAPSLSMGCAPAVDDDPPAIAWSRLENPVLALDDAAIKDAYAVRHDGRWHLGFSHVSEDPFRFRLGFAITADWSDVEVDGLLDQSETGGLASPTVTRAPDGRFVLTYNSHTRDVEGSSNKLYYRTSADMRSWSEPRRLVVAEANAPEDRLIDVTVVFADAGAFLFFKREQVANVAYSASADLDEEWTLLGPMEPGNLENIQVLSIDGVWHLLGTQLPLAHKPVLHRLDGDERDPAAWTTWTELGELEVPEEHWNTGEFPGYERSNAAYLIDDRDVDGYFYLLYAGSTELTSYEGRGHSSLGLARSEDMVIWEVP